MSMPDRRIIPALMFHSVGLENYPWVWNHISESIKSFEAKIKILKSRGFSTIEWDMLYHYMSKGRSLPPDSILLTFDDGYLDNWVYVYPILKKYGMKATIFVNPDFVDPQDKPRPNLEDVWNGRCNFNELRAPGFLSWAEMRKMESSGLIDIQSHSLTHTWYFSGPKVIDVHRPEKIATYPWLYWNSFPEHKPYYLNENQSDFVPLGMPIFEHTKSLVARRFFPDNTDVDKIVKYVDERGGASFLSLSKNRQKVIQHISNMFGPQGIGGFYESDNDADERIYNELYISKKRIEDKLHKTVDFICWPGGGNNEHVQLLAGEAGYKSWTLGSKDKSFKRNVPGANPMSIKRMGTSNKVSVKGRECGRGGWVYQMLKIYAHQGSGIYILLLKFYKLLFLAGANLGIENSISGVKLRAGQNND